MLRASKRGKCGRHTALITAVEIYTCENCEEGHFCWFNDFNEVLEVFEEAIRRY